MNVQNNTLKIFISEHIDPKATPDEIKSLHNFNHSRSAEFDITPNGIRLKHFESDFAPGARKDEVECRVADNSIYIECAQLLHEFVLTDTNCKEEMIQFSLK